MKEQISNFAEISVSTRFFSLLATWPLFFAIYYIFFIFSSH